MVTHYARTAYLQAKVQPETDPKRLILMLYEGALEDIRLAREGILEHNARKRGEHLSRAVAIVSALNTALDSNVTDEPIAFLRGLYQAMLVELSKVAVTHDLNVLDLAFRYLERLKQIWEQNVMGRQTQAPEDWHETPRVVMHAPIPALVTQRSAYGVASGVGQRTFSV